jgi:hypothetical protein
MNTGVTLTIVLGMFKHITYSLVFHSEDVAALIESKISIVIGLLEVHLQDMNIVAIHHTRYHS